MKHNKRFNTQSEGVGYIATTPFTACIKGNKNKVLFIPPSAGDEVEIVDDGSGFITYGGGTGGKLDAIYFGNGGYYDDCGLVVIEISNWNNFVTLCNKYDITHVNGQELKTINNIASGCTIQCDESTRIPFFRPVADIIDYMGTKDGDYHNLRAEASQFTSSDGSVTLADIDLTASEYNTWKLPNGVEMSPIQIPM